MVTIIRNAHDIEAAAAAPQEGVPVFGPDGLVYPGTCRPSQPPSGPLPTGSALRLDLRRALEVTGFPLCYTENGLDENGRSGQVSFGKEVIDTIGDIVLSRRDMDTSYHLSVVLDDATQGISDVSRGQDLSAATVIHVILQNLLGLPTPQYHHHRLIRDAAGKRLAKRDDARALATYRDQGKTPADIRRMVGLGLA